jgi:hypothetical protein
MAGRPHRSMPFRRTQSPTAENTNIVYPPSAIPPNRGVLSHVQIRKCRLQKNSQAKKDTDLARRRLAGPRWSNYQALCTVCQSLNHEACSVGSHAQLFMYDERADGYLRGQAPFRAVSTTRLDNYRRGVMELCDTDGGPRPGGTRSGDG